MAQTVTRAMLCDRAIHAAHVSRSDAEHVADRMFALIAQSLMQAETVKLTGFGSLQVRGRAERIGRNPRTGTEHTITARRAVVFTPSARLRDALHRQPEMAT